jgi:hypothetical protein
VKKKQKYSTEEVTPPIKIKHNAIKNPKLLANSFNTYFLTIIERMNNGTTTLTTEDATKYLIEAIPKTFPNINLMPTTVNEIKSTKILSNQKIHVVMMKYQQLYSKAVQTMLAFP